MAEEIEKELLKIVRLSSVEGFAEKNEQCPEYKWCLSLQTKSGGKIVAIYKESQGEYTPDRYLVCFRDLGLFQDSELKPFYIWGESALIDNIETLVSQIREDNERELNERYLKFLTE